MIPNTPYFSIITVCYNCCQELEKTIRSVISQKGGLHEYIVIDGASTDGTVELINKYSKYIDKWKSEPDKGIYDAMNKGLRMASGTYVIFMNAGDTFYKDTILGRVYSQLDNVDFACGIAHVDGLEYWIPISGKKINDNVLYGHNVNHQASIIKRSLLQEGYDTSYPIIADDLFFIKSVYFEHASYKRLWIVTNNYDNSGVSSSKDRIDRIKQERCVFLKKYNLPSEKYSNRPRASRYQRALNRIMRYYIHIFLA